MREEGDAEGRYGVGRISVDMDDMGLDEGWERVCKDCGEVGGEWRCAGRGGTGGISEL